MFAEIFTDQQQSINKKMLLKQRENIQTTILTDLPTCVSASYSHPYCLKKNDPLNNF